MHSRPSEILRRRSGAIHRLMDAILSCCGLSGKIGLAAAAAACSTKPFFWLPPITSLTVTNYSTTKGMHLIWEAYLKTWEECLMMLQKT
ncbi:hypothetical protein Acr_08g0010260 [Actinidia rufa]|uniref:Uncharacterized protein n=1 Tax=Actinidia rufa TaxID=165716 RepID=A0A7J0F1U7_9ERIC|nr:hypothetical protein Acr_08g0010260 [Actinidia rufa]